MGTEKAIIKDSKGSGGIVGIMNQKAALVRWTLTRHFLTSFSSAMNDRAGITSTSNTSHEEMKQTALKRDEEQVQAIVNHLNETMTDPFDIEAHPPCLMNISTCMHATREVQDYLLSAVNEDVLWFWLIDNILSHPVGPTPVSMFHEDGTMRKTCKSDLVKQVENEVSPVLSLPHFDPSLTSYIRDSMAWMQRSIEPLETLLPTTANS
jgi:hypothetical protein